MRNRTDVKVMTEKYLLMFAATFFAAMFQTFSLKANIGVIACWDAIGMNLYEICGLKVGTCSMLMGCACVATQAVILKKRFHWTRLLQLPLAVFYGSVVNLFYYDVFTFPVDGYGMRLFFCLFSTVGMAVFLGISASLNLIPTTAEGVSITIAREYQIDYGKVRLSIDVLAIAASILLSLAFGLSFKIREGTILCAVLLGPLTGFFMKLEEKWIPLCRR